jgi:hypothetical protein
MSTVDGREVTRQAWACEISRRKNENIPNCYCYSFDDFPVHAHLHPCQAGEGKNPGYWEWS